MAGAALNFTWERITQQVRRCRLPFCDVTIGLVHGGGEVLLIDTGTTLTKARAIAADVRAPTGRDVDHVLLTHHHFDHVLGHSVFEGAQTYCSPQVVATMETQRRLLRDHAVSYGADPGEVDRAVAALLGPSGAMGEAVIALGHAEVVITHPGRGHTDHDAIAVISGAERTVVFCGDLVEESGEPNVDDDSDLTAWPLTLQRVLSQCGESAAYVPGHGAVVDAAFVRRQATWLANRGHQ